MLLSTNQPEPKVQDDTKKNKMRIQVNLRKDFIN